MQFHNTCTHVGQRPSPVFSMIFERNPAGDCIICNCISCHESAPFWVFAYSPAAKSVGGLWCGEVAIIQHYIWSGPWAKDESANLVVYSCSVHFWSLPTGHPPPQPSAVSEWDGSFCPALPQDLSPNGAYVISILQHTKLWKKVGWDTMGREWVAEAAYLSSFAAVRLLKYQERPPVCSLEAVHKTVCSPWTYIQREET